MPELDCQSLPFGDQLNCFSDPNGNGNLDDSTPLHFTGKERDTETGEANGNDYFGARYFASGLGRFMTPDWSAKYEPVPYAKLDNPQTLNLYAYVQNNPLTMRDPDGHQQGGASFPIQTKPWDGWWTGTDEGSHMADMCDFGIAEACDDEGDPGWGALGISEPFNPPQISDSIDDWPAMTFAQASRQHAFGTGLLGFEMPMQIGKSFTQGKKTGKIESNIRQYYFHHWLMDLKSCYWDAGIGTIANQMDPFAPNVSNAVQGTVDSTANAALWGAAAHSVERSLTVPLRSSIVRAGVRTSEALGEASGYITIANLYYGIGKAYKAEWTECGW
ncbi:MAG: RHS repeat-associated core domain-containing protein [Acidobacteriota bacterium]